MASSSGFEAIRNSGLKLPAPKDDPHFWREFFRVQSDKMILLGVIMFLHFAHADERLQSMALGGLIVLVQGQRFKWGK